MSLWSQGESTAAAAETEQEAAPEEVSLREVRKSYNVLFTAKLQILVLGLTIKDC